MTPNKSYSGELDRILDGVHWGDYQRDDGTWGRGISNRQLIKAALTTHIQTIGEEIIGKDVETDPYNPDGHDENRLRSEQRKRLAHYLRKDKE